MAVEFTQNSIHPKRVKQTTGQSEDDLMSQKAVAGELGKIRQVPAGTQGQIVGFDVNGNPIAVEDAGGTGVFAPVADLLALKALDTTIAKDWPDKWAIYVESVRLFYALDRESTAAGDDDLIVSPVAGVGRWIRNTLPLATSSKPGLMRAGDPIKIDESENLRADLYQGTVGLEIYDNIFEPISYASSGWMFNYSTFSGWGSPIGMPQNFNGVKMRLRARSTPVTSIRIALFVGNKSGTVLVDRTLAITINANEAKEIVFDLGETIANTNGDKLYFAYYCNQLIDCYAISSALPYTVAGGYGVAAYKTGGSTDTLSLTDSSTPINLWFQTGLTQNQVMGQKYSTAAEMVQDVAKPTVEILIPSVIYATEGVEANIYFDNVVFADFPLAELAIDISCTKGKQFDKFWRYTPVAGDAGNTPFTVSVSRNGVVLASKSCTLYTTTAANAGAKSIKVIAVGDSTTTYGQYIGIINTDYAALNQPAMSFLGTKGTAPSKHEGRPGWKFADYATVGRIYYKFTISGVTTTPEIGTIYSHNGSNFNVRETNVSAGSGTISCEKTSGSNEPLASGTLSKANGGAGDSSISFSAFTKVSGNPFWNNTTAQLDVSKYLTDNGITLTASDLITFHLGINDIFNEASDATITGVITHAVRLINAFRAAVPDIKIGLCLTIPPAINQDGFADSNANGQTLKGYLANYKKLIAAYLAEFDTSARRTAFTYVAGFNHSIDRYYGFPRTTVNASARSTVQVTKFTNDVHPANEGYYQMGDSLYSFIRNIV